MLMRSGLGPTKTRSREFLSIELQGAARPTCTSRRWRLSFPSSCAALGMTRNTRGRGRRGAGFADTAARASVSWRTRAGARPRRPLLFFSIDESVRVSREHLLSECLLFREQFLRGPAFVERTASCVRYRIDAGAATLTSESSCRPSRGAVRCARQSGSERARSAGLSKQAYLRATRPPKVANSHKETLERAAPSSKTLPR